MQDSLGGLLEQVVLQQALVKGFTPDRRNPARSVNSTNAHSTGIDVIIQPSGLFVSYQLQSMEERKFLLPAGMAYLESTDSMGVPPRPPSRAILPETPEQRAWS